MTRRSRARYERSWCRPDRRVRSWRSLRPRWCSLSHRPLPRWFCVASAPGAWSSPTRRVAGGRPRSRRRSSDSLVSRERTERTARPAIRASCRTSGRRHGSRSASFRRHILPGAGRTGAPAIPIPIQFEVIGRSLERAATCCATRRPIARDAVHPRRWLAVASARLIGDTLYYSTEQPTPQTFGSLENEAIPAPDPDVARHVLPGPGDERPGSAATGILLTTRIVSRSRWRPARDVHADGRGGRARRGACGRSHALVLCQQRTAR